MLVKRSRILIPGLLRHFERKAGGYPLTTIMRRQPQKEGVGFWIRCVTKSVSYLWLLSNSYWDNSDSSVCVILLLTSELVKHGFW